MAKIPEFEKETDEVRFWDERTLDEFDEDLKREDDVQFVRPKKQLVSVRLDINQIKILRKIASQKGIGYLTLIRMWLTEKVNEELKRVS